MKQIYFLDETEVVDKQLFGAKGAGLAIMAGMGLQVPKGFVITTEVCKQILSGKLSESKFFSELKSAIRELEKKTGKKFGSSEKPLILSVRSGAAVSMAGMMDSILNVGINTKTMNGLYKKSKDKNMAINCYEYLCTQFENYDNSTLPDEPWDQLIAAIWLVSKSWDNKRAIAYREKKQISEEMADGTAIVVMEMVFGNMNKNSGTGIVFTRNPYDGTKQINGEFLEQHQGTDLVSGKITPRPIDEMKSEFIKELEEICEKLEKRFKAPQEIEFTIEDGELYLLQTRNSNLSQMAKIKATVDLMHDGIITMQEAKERAQVGLLLGSLPKMVSPESAQKSILITSGIGASIGCVSGIVSFDTSEAIALANAGKKVILVRRETSPEDVAAMFKSVGILTSTGGKTSHAAVIAAGLGKPCVVGCTDIEFARDNSSFRCGNVIISSGWTITIDGKSGNVYAGEPDLVDYPIPKELDILLKELA